ncbi:hypothetical protein SK128_014847 [Halocaridina rubra]|uniref:Uncharacterized protein n=1 Tax=Halocaridina rubra TaxID=373956 RepID=A0AAN8XLV4_HALRR
MGCCVMFDENLELRPSVSAHYLNDVPSILVAAGVCNPNMFRTLEDIIHNYKMENLYGPSYDAHENIPRKAHYSNTSANRSSVVLSESSVASMPIHSVTKETSRHLPMEPSRYSYPASCFQTDFQNNSSNGHTVTSSSLLETSCSPTLWHSTGFMHVPSLNEIYSDNTRNKPGSENSLSGNLTSSLSTPNVKPAYTTSFTTNTVPIQPVNVVKSNRQMLLDSLRQASLQACNTQRLYESSQRSKYRNYGSTQLNPVMTYPHGVQSTTSTNNLVSACNISTSSFVPLTDSTTVSSKSNFQKHYFPLCGYRCGNYLKCSTYHSTNLLQPSAIIAKSSEEHPDVLNVKMPSTQLPNVRDTTVILCTSHHGDVDPQCSKSSSLLSSTSQPANPPKLTRNPRLNQRSSTRPLRRPKTSTAGSAVNLDTLPDTPENTSVSFKPLNDTEINNCKPCISFHYHPSSSCQVPLPNTKLSGSSSMVSSQYNCPPNKLVPYVKSVLNQPNNNSEALSCLAHSHYGLFLSNDSKVPGKKSQEKVNTSSGPNTLDYKMQSSLIMRASPSLRKGILSEEKTKGMEFDVPGNQVPAEMEQLNSNIENMAQISASFLPHNCSNLTGNCIVRQGGHCKVGATTCLESNKFPSFDYRKRDAHMQRVILLSQEICELKCLLQDKKLKFEQFECLSGGSSGCCCSTMQDLQMDILDIKVQYRKKRKVLDDFLSGLQS